MDCEKAPFVTQILSPNTYIQIRIHALAHAHIFRGRERERESEGKIEHSFPLLIHIYNHNLIS